MPNVTIYCTNLQKTSGWHFDTFIAMLWSTSSSDTFTKKYLRESIAIQKCSAMHYVLYSRNINGMQSTQKAKYILKSWMLFPMNFYQYCICIQLWQNECLLCFYAHLHAIVTTCIFKVLLDGKYFAFQFDYGWIYTLFNTCCIE